MPGFRELSGWLTGPLLGALWLSCLLAGTNLARALPPEFEQTLVVGNLKDPVSMAFAPDGRLFILERITGNIRILDPDGVLLPEPFATLDVPPQQHRSGGLRSMAFDPDFASNGYIYVFYTKQFPVKRHNRVSRFTADPNNPDRVLAGSELVLMELPFNDHPSGSSGSHNGGAVFFGADGYLYFTTGDGWQASGGYGAGDNVQSLSTFTGKLFRIAKDGSIPTDNPFYNQTTGDYRAIWALGFRNPYSGGVHPVTGEIFIYDVGTVWAGNKDYVYKVSAGDNGRHDGGSTVSLGNLISPWVFTGSRVISGGAWYYGALFPQEYLGSLFVSAWGGDDIKRVNAIDDPTVSGFADDGVADNGPVYVQVGPDGALYYLITTYTTSTGAIYRIGYNGVSRAAAPAITPFGGTYVASVQVSMTTFTEDAEVRYTLDGSEPGIGSTLYSGPVDLTQSATLKARAFKDGLEPSTATSAVFTIEPGSPPQFTSQPPETAVLGAELLYDAGASGSPDPSFSLVLGPPEASINESSGLLRWTPDTAGPAQFTIRADNGIGSPADQNFTVDVLDVRLAENPPSEDLTSGLHVSIFEGTIPTSADLRLRQADQAGTLPGLRNDPLGQSPHFAARFEGFLIVPETGDYTFFLNANTAARMKLGTELLVEATGAESDATLGLEAGRHAVTLEFFAQNGAPAFSLEWQGPGFARTAVTDADWNRFLVQPGVFPREASPAFLNFPATENEPLPLTLSATGAFADVGELIPEPGILEFGVASPLWSDAAAKRRWMSLPTGTQVTWSRDQHWVFPPGTVFIKHFELGEEGYRLETRFTIVKNDGSIYGVTYRWRRDHSDADLVNPDGLSEEVRFDLGQRRQWTYPGRGDCLACHTPSAGFVLGPRAGQLNFSRLYSGSAVQDNQLQTLVHLGVFENPPDETALANAPAYDPIDQVAADLEHRIRSYLEANCATCHNPGNPMEGAALDLRYATPLAATGLINGEPSNDLGIAGAAIINPRDPRRSILYRRIASNDPAIRMPPLARDVVDQEMAEHLLKWIDSLEQNLIVDVTDTVHRWEFEQSLVDSSGDAPGTWRAGGSPTYSVGQLGDAVSLDGSGDGIELGALNLNPTEFTLSLWFYADDFGVHDARFISRATGVFDDDHWWMLSTLDGSKLRMRLKTNGSTSTLISNAGVLSTGDWTHIAGVYDGSRMILYRNGQEVASLVKTGSVDQSGTVQAAIGNQPTAAGETRPFDGLLDDIRIFDRALSPAEILTLSEAPDSLNNPPEPLITSPADGSVFTETASLTLTLTATDPEDGDVTNTATWTSSRDGVLPGNGSSLSLTGLSAGGHTLYATVTDSQGIAASDSVRITILPGFDNWAFLRGVPGLEPLNDEFANGLAAILEYGFLIEPRERDGVPVEQGQVVIDEELYQTVSFPINKQATDLTYILEGCDTLPDWREHVRFTIEDNNLVRTVPEGSSPEVVHLSAIEQGDAWLVTERLATPIGPGKPQGYLRVQILR